MINLAKKSDKISLRRFVKTTTQIAKECGVINNEVRNIADKERMVTVKKRGIVHYTELQEQRIHQLLYFGGKTEFLTLESKMNYE